MKDMAKLGGILFLIAAICAGLVGFVNEITKEPIEKQKMEAKQEAMINVLPSADSFEEAEANDEIEEVQIGSKDGEKVGYALTVVSKGYADPIEIMVGITSDGVIEGIEILASNETPGLGDNASEPSFTDQFKEKSTILKVSTSGASSDDEISAITGATVTSVAITDGVNKAIEYVESQGGGSQ